LQTLISSMMLRTRAPIQRLRLYFVVMKTITGPYPGKRGLRACSDGEPQ